MISQMVSYDLLWTNGPPIDSGIMTGTALDFKKYFKIKFGAYDKTNNPPTTTKSIKYRTKPCIWLGPNGNIQVPHWFLNLRTGHHIKRFTLTPLPAPPHTISRVNELSHEENRNPYLDLCDRHGNPIKDAYLTNTTITSHDTETKGVYEIGVDNEALDQLGNEHQKYEIAGAEYDKNGETEGVDENTPVVAVDTPLN